MTTTYDDTARTVDRATATLARVSDRNARIMAATMHSDSRDAMPLGERESRMRNVWHAVAFWLLELVGTVRSETSHAPDVIGSYPRTVADDGAVTYAPANGAPARWATRLPDPMALPQSEVKVGRNKRGTTRKVVGPWPAHKVTLGDVHYVDPIVDLVASVNGTGPERVVTYRDGDQVHQGTTRDVTELDLIRHADAILSASAARDGETWPTLIGSGPGRSQQLPERIPTDRSSGGATSADDDDYVSPVTTMRRRHRRMVLGVGTYVASSKVTRRRGKVTTTTTLTECADDAPMPRPVTLPLVTDRNGASVFGDQGTTIRDRYVARTMVKRANRLRACSRPYREDQDANQVKGTHKRGCTCQHDSHGLAVIGTQVTYDAQGTPRETQLLGRRTAVATECVAWGDGGYWLGHTWHADAERKPRAARSPEAAATARKRTAQRRAAARASDAARLDAILKR